MPVAYRYRSSIPWIRKSIRQMILAIYVLQFSRNCIIIPSVKKLTLQIVFFTNPLLIIYTPLEAADSSPVGRFSLFVLVCARE